MFKLTEDNPREVEPDMPEEGEKELPSTKAMNNLDMWVHSNVGILKNCRTSHMDPEVPEGEEIEPEELMRRIEAADPYDSRLKGISIDK